MLKYVYSTSDGCRIQYEQQKIGRNVMTIAKEANKLPDELVGSQKNNQLFMAA
jgi:hypothetical protein